MVKNVLSFAPVIEIPNHLVGEVRSKLAYVDEWITGARIAEDGGQIDLDLREIADEKRSAEIEEKVQRVVAEMAKGAFQPKVEVLEDFLDRPVPYQADPMDELLASGEVFLEDTGIYTLGPLVTRLVDYFEGRFLALADYFGAEPYRFPTLIPAKLLDRVD